MELFLKNIWSKDSGNKINKIWPQKDVEPTKCFNYKKIMKQSHAFSLNISPE